MPGGPLAVLFMGDFRSVIRLPAPSKIHRGAFEEPGFPAHFLDSNYLCSYLRNFPAVLAILPVSLAGLMDIQSFARLPAKRNFAPMVGDAGPGTVLYYRCFNFSRPPHRPAWAIPVFAASHRFMMRSGGFLSLSSIWFESTSSSIHR